MSADRCHLTDLPTKECACEHHHHAEQTVVSITTLERLAGRPLPEYRARLRPPWRVPQPEATVCEHRRDDLCPTCDQLLDGLLTDLPHLVEELGFTARKDIRFPDRGWKRGDTETPDEAPLAWHPAAANLLADLHALMAGHAQALRNDQLQWEAVNIRDRRALLQHLSRLAARAHRIIDRPRDRVFTMCPKCRTDIELRQRGDNVLCPNPECDYTAAWAQHQTDLLDASGDVLLTMGELCAVLTSAGEPMSRARVEKMITRHGLPREPIGTPHWREGRVVVTEPRWAYRLRDVREIQAQIDARKPQRRGTV